MKKLLVATLSSLLVITSTPLTYAQVPQRTPPAMKLSEPMPANLFEELARIVNPAVVNISTLATPRGRGGGMYRDPMMDLLEQLYGGGRGRRQQLPQQQNKPIPMGLGTGFIIREDGLIVTNNHVIQGAEGIKVQLTEKTDKLYDAVVVGSDDRTDIALIKITPDGKLPVVALGSSKDVNVGEWVAAFGNPFGHGHSMTKGIISSKGREIGEINKIPLLQTDASINPGNSGGPLVDTKGYVIGVNSAIDARAQGIGFAIPIDEVKAIIPQLETKGRIQRGYIGVTLADLDPSIDPEYLGLSEAEGAVITSVDKNGPAGKGGIRPYDIVTEVNGKKIKSSTELADTVSDTKIGSTATFKYVRNGKAGAASVKIAERPDFRAMTQQKSQSKPQNSQKASSLGFTTADLTDPLRAEFQVPENIKNPIVVEVERSSLASSAGLQVGDIILDINKKEVKTAADIPKLLKSGANTIRVARNGRMMLIMIQNN